ncbi:MAG: hypothetical protein DMF56_07300 [Acidobacteria bacterium]|nr:MAG: hypothetical protein DMF56_07300 [Acidobacteriota bacterium]
MPVDFDSTLIRRGRAAVTMTELAAFVKTLEERPVCTLLEELPQIARLSDTKFSLALTTLRRRFRGETPADQLQLRATAWEIAKGVDDRNTADRIRGIFTVERA